MGRTIIQPIGPLYGEAVNGTVFGRPNGSIFVPSSNTITLTLLREYITNNASNAVYPSDNTGTIKNQSIQIVAESQDNQAYMRLELAEDNEFTQNVATANIAAGIFNITRNGLYLGNYPLTDGSTYYIRAVLVSSTNVPVATSAVFEVTAVIA